LVSPSPWFLFALVSISSTSEEVQRRSYRYYWGLPRGVSISSTSEEVQRVFLLLLLFPVFWFPLVQLPKKFKGFCVLGFVHHRSPVSISSTSEEVQRLAKQPLPNWETEFPLVQLPKKFKAVLWDAMSLKEQRFPLVQLPKKFKVGKKTADQTEAACFH